MSNNQLLIAQTNVTINRENNESNERINKQNNEREIFIAESNERINRENNEHEKYMFDENHKRSAYRNKKNNELKERMDIRKNLVELEKYFVGMYKFLHDEIHKLL